MKRTTVITYCDIDQITEDVQPVTVRLNGTVIDRDLCARHREPIEHALRIIGLLDESEPEKPRSLQATMREWAQAHGMLVKARGALSRDVIVAYEAAMRSESSV